MKDKKVFSQLGKKSPQQLFNDNFGYTLQNVPLSTNWHLDHILNHIKHQKYVCLLKYSSGRDKHVVSIDCDSSPKLIFDCMEGKAIHLSRKNLDNLSRDNDNTVIIKKITLCYKLLDIKESPYRKIWIFSSSRCISIWTLV